MKILLLEDDLILNEILEEHLSRQNYKVISIFSSNKAIEHLYSEKFDLLILDVNVPDLNGFSLLKELRENNILTPTIFITSLNMVEDMQKGFDSGCDDYIKKPFELKELDLRVNNIKRLFNLDNKLELSPNLYLDIKNQIVEDKKRVYSLARKECEVLAYLFKNSEKIVSIEELSNNIWAYEDNIDSATVRTYIKNLRKIIGDGRIINIRGAGYKFIKE